MLCHSKSQQVFMCNTRPAWASPTHQQINSCVAFELEVNVVNNSTTRNKNHRQTSKHRTHEGVSHPMSTTNPDVRPAEYRDSTDCDPTKYEGISNFSKRSSAILLRSLSGVCNKQCSGVSAWFCRSAADICMCLQRGNTVDFLFMTELNYFHV